MKTYELKIGDRIKVQPYKEIIEVTILNIKGMEFSVYDDKAYTSMIISCNRIISKLESVVTTKEIPITGTKFEFKFYPERTMINCDRMGFFSDSKMESFMEGKCSFEENGVTKYIENCRLPFIEYFKDPYKGFKVTIEEL